MTVTNATPAVQKFCDIWQDCFVAVLGQLGVVNASGSVIGQPAPSSTPEAPAPTRVRFSTGGALKGDLFWLAEPLVALQCAQLLMSEPLNPAATFSDAHRDAFAELLRQVSGAVASSWKQAAGKEIEIKFESGDSPTLPPQFSAGLGLSGEKIPKLSLNLILSAELCDALNASPLDPPQQPVSPSISSQEAAVPPAPSAASPSFFREPSSPLPSAPFPEPSSPSNLDLLLDVELEATIRFGRHEMLLREIFGLMPGAVVELDQMVNEPAELLVAGRLIARGSVVVVDGNFGLQVTEVASASQRAELLQM